jgi:Tfp pilus assembly protein PilO
MEQILIHIIAPIVSGLAGWFASAYRNRQRKEIDQLEVARQYKELLADALEDKRTLYAEIDKLRDELRAVREEVALLKEVRTRMRLAVAKAVKCPHAAGCPVIRDFNPSKTKNA